uniref:Ribosomal protein L20 n=1 Tax=Rhodogorgon sp. TaxID=2485824 RepID=A0A3G3MIL8_9FLOR|nr:ribosomal protein L20 [Rhodogorgon sp.]
MWMFSLKYSKKYKVLLVNRKDKKQENRKIWIKKIKSLNHMSSVKFGLMVYFFGKQKIKLNRKMFSNIIHEEKATLFSFNNWSLCFYYSKFY